MSVILPISCPFSALRSQSDQFGIEIASFRQMDILPSDGENFIFQVQGCIHVLYAGQRQSTLFL